MDATITSVDITIEPRDSFVLATATGRASLAEALETCRSILDAAADRGFDKILLDCLGLDCVLSNAARYELGTNMADYCRSRSIRPRVAVVGKLPTITGFAARLASHHGVPVETFAVIQAAVDWLNEAEAQVTAS